jgi:hypothetical protein
VRPGWWKPEDVAAGRDFVIAHAEVAILAPEENTLLEDAGLESRMPAEWWDAPLQEKRAVRFARYLHPSVGIHVEPWDKAALAGGSASGS